MVGAVYGHVSSSSWGTIGKELGQKHSMERFSKGTIGARTSKTFREKFVF